MVSDDNVVTTQIRSTSVAVVLRQFSDFFTVCITKLWRGQRGQTRNAVRVRRVEL